MDIRIHLEYIKNLNGWLVNLNKHDMAPIIQNLPMHFVDDNDYYMSNLHYVTEKMINLENIKMFWLND